MVGPCCVVGFRLSVLILVEVMHPNGFEQQRQRVSLFLCFRILWMSFMCMVSLFSFRLCQFVTG